MSWLTTGTGGRPCNGNQELVPLSDVPHYHGLTEPICGRCPPGCHKVRAFIAPGIDYHCFARQTRESKRRKKTRTSFSRRRRERFYWNNQSRQLSSPFTSLIRLNPEKATTEGDTAGRAVLGEAGKSPVEKQIP